MITLIFVVYAFFAKKKVPEFLFLGTAFVVLFDFTFSSFEWLTSVTGALIFIFLSRRLLNHEKRDIAGLGCFVVAFLFFLFGPLYLFSSYMPIGERPRDFALLQQAYHGGTNFEEPWFSGNSIRYYVFWYLFYAFWGRDLNLGVPATYISSTALVMTFATTFTFRFLEKHFKSVTPPLNFSTLGLIVISFVTLLLPNLKTVYYCLFASCKDVSTWWSASRVVSGGITEYPLWSYVLGDLHPHFLSTPALVYLLFLFSKSIISFQVRQTLVLGGMSFVYALSSNMWELIFWFCVFSCCLFFHILRGLSNSVEVSKTHTILVSCYFIGFLSLGFTFKPIGGDPLRLINPLTHGLKLDEFFAHFGLHIIFLVAVTLINYTKIPKNFLACLCLLLGLSIGFNSSFLFLIFLICVSFAQKTSTTALFLLLVTFLTLLVPEILYLDDPYGGDAERLNTIFKTYYPSYISFSLACAHLFIHSPLPIRTLFSITYLLFTLTGLVFNLSSRPLTGHDFYAEIKKEIPDALPCIKMKMVRGVVLESEKEPYSWDSFFCTLSENICYLGWSNHIGLLYRNYGEIERRKSVMSRIYEGEQSCNDLSNLINTERIDYVFVGPKEKERYNINYQKFENCLKKICATKNASLYSVR